MLSQPLSVRCWFLLFGGAALGESKVSGKVKVEVEAKSASVPPPLEWLCSVS